MSEQWGWRMMAGLKSSEGSIGDSLTEADRYFSAKVSDPKSWDQLDGGVRDLLKPDGFNLFCETLLCRRPAAWRQDAALRVVEWLLDKSEKTFVDVNVFPGSGKSTLFTHDIPLWLICGGGAADPEWGRALRILLGHETKTVSVHYVLELRRLLVDEKPYYDKEQKRESELVLLDAFGRFKPNPNQGEPMMWAEDQFIVAQIKRGLYNKEPTVQAASYQSGFLGERVDFYSWDDLTTEKNSRKPEIAENMDRWFEKEAETRLEPGGLGMLVGQRLGPLDLHAKRLAKFWQDDDGISHQKYQHVVYKAHNEASCDADLEGGSHRQWDLKDEGCLLDEYRLPWREILKIRHDTDYRTVYQQEDSDPASILVLPIWLDGGQDFTEFDAPGCYDRDRSFFEVPDVAPKERFINYVCVDPAAGNWWAIEWWALLPDPKRSPNPYDWFRYLIYGRRAKLSAGGPTGFLDWDNGTQDHVGVMQELQIQSLQLGMPIRAWVMEKNSAHRHLFQYDHFRRWKQRWPWVTVIGHETQKNKNDPVLGVEALLPMAYRNGLKRLPRKSGTDTLNYMRRKVLELTTYPHVDAFDTVMADWFGENNLKTIARLGGRDIGEAGPRVEAHLAPYLRRQQKELVRR